MNEIKENTEKLENIKLYMKHCPLENPNYFLVDNRCYYIQTNSTKYETAKEACKEKLTDYGGMRLFQPRSTAQNELIVRLAHEATGLSNWMWIGITDNTTEGEYTYQSNGKPIKFDPSWHSGYGSRGTSYNCILTYVNGGSSSSFANWLDYDCTQQYRSVCELAQDEPEDLKNDVEVMKVNKNCNQKP